MQCRAKVFDSFLPCRLAVYRGNESHVAATAFPEYNKAYFDQPPLCRTAEDFQNLTEYFLLARFTDQQTVMERTAKQQCPDYCTKIWFKVELKTSSTESNSQSTMNASELLSSESLITSWAIVLVTSTVTTMTQFFSYDINQFIAELGGSWGLFLGASLITIFELLEKTVQACFPAVDG